MFDYMKVNPFKEKALFNLKVCYWIIEFSVLFWTLFHSTLFIYFTSWSLYL